MVRSPVYGSLRHRRGPAIAAVAAITVLAGCGLQAGSSRGPITVTVSRDFGVLPVGAASVARAPEGATAVAVLRQRFRVVVGPSGRVESIAGLRSGGRQRWSLYINGVVARPRARVYGDDRVWWDLDGPGPAPSAVVGAFPEPFVHGLGGKRLPTALECGSGLASACRRVATALSRAGVPSASQLLGGGSGQQSLTVEVATWSQLRGEVAATLLQSGPAASGVYARLTDRGLEVLDASGAQADTLAPTAGLIAAVAQGQSAPTWLVTGTNAAGVLAAAQAFTAGRLKGHFALALSAGHDLPVPR